MAKLAVLIVHGMGTQSDDYADPMIDELNDRLRALGQNPDHVLWKAAHWSHVLDGRENDLYRRLEQNHDLDWGALRRSLVLSGLGDAVAYQGPPLHHRRYTGRSIESSPMPWRRSGKGLPMPT